MVELFAGTCGNAASSVTESRKGIDTSLECKKVADSDSQKKAGGLTASATSKSMGALVVASYWGLQISYNIDGESSHRR
jgi:hypothetical protein